MKINIEKIKFKNLFSYGKQWQNFEPNGISFITGLNLNNDRRNFTGKSNLLKVFPFALFGRVEDLNKPRIVNWRNKKNAECFIHVNKGNDKYVIHRGIKPDILEVTKNGKELPQPSKKTDFQKQIEDEILGVDFQTFMNIVYADTNNSSSILKMSKPDKRKFLENIFDLEYYTNIKDKANKKINSISQSIDLTEQEIKYNEQRIVELENDVKNFENEYNKIGDSSEKLKEKKKEFDSLRDKLEEYLKEKNQLIENIQHLNGRKVKGEQIIFKLKSKAKELSRYIIKDVKEIDTSKLENEIKESKEKIESYNEKCAVLRKEIDSFPDNLIDEKSELNGKIQYNKSKIKELENEIKKVQPKIDNKLDDEICPTCFNEVDHQRIENHLKETKKSVDDELIIYKEVLSEDENKLFKIQNKLTEKKKLEDSLSDCADVSISLSERVRKLEKTLEEENEKKSKIEKSEKYKKAIKKLMVYKKYEGSLVSIEEQFKNNENKLAQIDNSIKSIEVFKNDIKLLEISVDQEEKERQKIDNWKQEAINKIEKAKIEIETKRKGISKSKTTKDYLVCIKDLCGDERAKKYTISNKIPLLNQRTNFYLSKAGVNFYTKIDSWLDIEIKGPGIKDAVYANLSGAEKVSLDRSLQFALDDINKLQSPTHFDLMILDEILDSSVDSIGLQNIVNIVKTKQEEDKSNILIVSHKQSFNELEDLVNNFYRIEFDGRYSHIKKI